MFQNILPVIIPLGLLSILCVLVWIQLFIRLIGKPIKAWLPTLFAAVLLPVLGLAIGFYREYKAEAGMYHWPLPLGWCVYIAEIAFFTGSVYIGVSLWLHLFDKWLGRK